MRCEYCGKFVGYGADSYTVYGCSSYDPPEPYDEAFLCKKHAKERYQDFLDAFKRGSRSGDWVKSEAERKAAKECGLAWVGGDGVGTLGTKDFASTHRYITQEEYDRLKKLPYYGYCEVCNSERRGGYCGREECEKSFKNSMTRQGIKS